MSLFEDVFCVHPVGAGVWQFEVDERFNGAFGGTNGGVAAAISLYAARDGSDVLAAAAIDCHFLKSCRPGRVTVRRRILNQGRTLTVVATETEDHEHRICTTALVTLVDRNALANHVSFAAERHVARGSPDQAMPWKHPKGARIPLIDTFLPEIVGANSDTTTTRIQLPFETRRATAEAAHCRRHLRGAAGRASRRGAGFAPEPQSRVAFQRNAGRLSRPAEPVPAGGDSCRHGVHGNRGEHRNRTDRRRSFHDDLPADHGALLTALNRQAPQR